MPKVNNRKNSTALRLQSFTASIKRSTALRLFSSMASIKRSTALRLYGSTAGFTLVELILYVTLVGILLTAAAIFASDVVLGSVKGRVRAKVQHEASFAMEKIRQEIVKGDAINLPSGSPPGSVLQINIPTNNVITVQINGNGSAQNILQMCAKTVSACSSTDPWQNLTSGEVEVTTLTFQNISSGTSLGEEAVKIQMTLKNKNPGGKKEFDAEVNLETSIALRL